ncbi:MAG: T9SS type A sorting domain-containing protein [Bacteroidia bacterium]
MEKIKRAFYAALLMTNLFFSMNKASAQTISPHYFGENAWMPDTIGNSNACTEPPCIFNGKLHKHWEDIKESGASIIRYGGIAPDKNMPTNYQYLRVIDSIRSKGMEPVIQVPFRDNRYNASQAAAIVDYLNNVKGKHIKYWVIGNEPNLGYSYTNASQIAAYIRPFASAMKAKDPSIQIVGPELAWFDTGIMDALTTPGGPNDITGKDAAGRYYIDVVSFHTYPFNGSQTRSQVISKLTAAGSYQDNLIHLNARVAAANSYHNRTGASALKTAVTEANIDWQNSASDGVTGLGANSFIGGQFVAEMLALGMKNNVDFINLWSVVEGSSPVESIGYIESSGLKKPTFWHFKMMADNFKGNYANGTSNKTNVKVFGSKNGTNIVVMIMNQESSGAYNYTVRLDNGTVSGANPLKVNVDAGVANEYTDAISNQSTVVLVFNTSGTIMKKTEYSMTTHALAGLPPVTTTFVSTGVSETTAPAEDNGFDVKIFPNPSTGKFTVELNKDNKDERQYDIEIMNLLGQKVYSSKSTFEKRQAAVDMNESFATGAYIVRVRQGETVVTRKIILENK